MSDFDSTAKAAETDSVDSHSAVVSAYQDESQERLRSRYLEEKKKSTDSHRPTSARDLRNELTRLRTLKELAPGQRVLDVGCGLGDWTVLLAGEGFDAHGLDFDPDFVEAANERAKAQAGSAVFTVGAAESIPYPDGHFDAVVCHYMLEHAADWRAVVSEIGRVLRPGGVAFLSTGCVLYPFTDEVRLPLYSYYPAFIKRRVIRLALTRYPGLVGYSPTPAINWLTPWTLKRAFRSAGFDDVRDIFDVVRTSELSGKKQQLAKLALPLLRRLPPVRTLAYFGYPALKIYARKADSIG